MIVSRSAPEMLVTNYLEMTSVDEFIPAFLTDDDVRIERLQVVDVHFYRYLYTAVGEKWRWRDRIIMPASELHAALSRPTTQVYVLYVSGAPAGYVELSREVDSVEIAYFGLREEYMGRGLGKHLLSFGIQKAWEMNPRRVWLHTCNMDGPHALENYCKRGFRVYKQDSEPMPQRYR
jgi:GNAT superfamily N-acetyltransferase